MKEILDRYVDVVFGERKQAEFKFKQFEHNYRALFPEDRSAPLLDLGVGRGELLSCLKNWGYTSAFGVDISPSTVEFCRSLGLDCRLIEDGEVWLTRNPAGFAVITLLDVLEHIPRERVIPMVAALKGALRPGGRLILQVPNLQAPDATLHRYNDFTHASGFTENSLGQVLAAGGFRRYSFRGFEPFVFGGAAETLKKTLRPVLHFLHRAARSVNGNLNPRILNPVLVAVADAD